MADLPPLALEILSRVDRFFTAGGVVMWPLLLLGGLLWYLLTLRAFELRKGMSPDVVEGVITGKAATPARSGGLLPTAVAEVRRLIDGPATAIHDVELVVRRARDQADQHARAARSLVAAAPLLGLLGTVVGMIETFNSLQDMALYAEAGGGVAGGISAALTTTEMGLGIAIPGLLVERLLHTRERAIRGQLDRVEQLARQTLTARGAT